LKNKKRKFKLPQNQNFYGQFRSDTFNEDDLTAELVWTTGQKVKRFSFFEGEYFEELSLKKDHVNLERLNLGAPLLNNHESRTLGDNIGVVRKAWISKGEGRAIVQFSSRDEIKGIVQDVRDGVIKNVSVGYRVEKFEDVSKKRDEIPTFRAVDWTPMELSLVNIPADQDSQVRSAAQENKNQHYECDVFSKEKEMTKEQRKAAIEKLVTDLGLDETIARKMIDSEKTFEDCQTEAIELVAAARNTDPIVEPVVEPKVEPVVEPELDTDKVRSEAAAAEKTRSTEITKLVNSVGLEREISEKMINDDVTIEAARKEVITMLAERNKKNPTNSITVEVSVEHTEKRRAACVRALAHRQDPVNNKLETGDNAFLGGSLQDSAREFLQSEGVNVRGLHGSDLCKRALHHSSDFGLVLEDLSNKSIRAAYQEAPQTHMPFTSERNDIKDFKDISSTQLGHGSGLLPVNEHGEYQKGTLSESAEKYKVEKFGRIIGLTWELLLNDDLGAFTRIPANLGRKARIKEGDLVWAIITGNPVMLEDGKTLFHADHNNLVTGPGTALSVTSLGVQQSKMRLQTELDGGILNLTPSLLMVPTSLEVKAKQLTRDVSPEKESDVNPFSSQLQVIVEPRLDADSALSWYQAAAKGAIEMVELARLEGRGPEISTREGFAVDGMETKIRYVFGVKALDFRGLSKNVGA